MGTLERVIGDKIVVLDTIYTYAQTPAAKARILAEILALLKIIGFSFDGNIKNLLTEALIVNPYEYPDIAADLLIKLNEIRAEILVTAVEHGLIAPEKILLVGGIKSSEEDEDEVYLE